MRDRGFFQSGCWCGRGGLCLRFPIAALAQPSLVPDRGKGRGSEEIISWYQRTCIPRICSAMPRNHNQTSPAHSSSQFLSIHTCPAIAIHLLTNIPDSASLVVIMPNLFACANLTSASTFSWREISSSTFFALYGSAAGAPDVPGPVVFVPGLDILVGEVEKSFCGVMMVDLWMVEFVVRVRKCLVVEELLMGIRWWVFETD